MKRHIPTINHRLKGDILLNNFSGYMKNLPQAEYLQDFFFFSVYFADFSIAQKNKSESENMQLGAWSDGIK